MVLARLPGILVRVGRAGMVDRYRSWRHDRPAVPRRIPSELAGRALGWCAPASCHADVLAGEARHAGR